MKQSYTFRIDQAQRKALEKAARKQKKYPSELIREAIQKYLGK